MSYESTEYILEIYASIPQVSIMGDRIRVKGPRLSKESVVTVRETFLPPSMSLVEFFKKEQPIDTSNMFEVDSDCEVGNQRSTVNGQRSTVNG